MQPNQRNTHEEAEKKYFLLVLFSFSHRSFLFPQQRFNIQFSFIRLCSQLALLIGAFLAEYNTQYKKFLTRKKKKRKKNKSFNDGDWIIRNWIRNISAWRFLEEEKWC